MSLESAPITSENGSVMSTQDPSSTLDPAPGASDTAISCSGSQTMGSGDEPVSPYTDEGQLLELVLSGYNTPSKLSEKTGLNREDVQRVWDDPKFQLAILGARRDMGLYVVGWIKRHSLEYAKRMHQLAVSADDERVAFQANKDLLDRAGTSGQTRIALGSPLQYKQLVEELSEAE